MFGVILMRFFAGLLAYLVGLSAVISIGIAGLMALQAPTEQTSSAPTVAGASHKERLVKPVKQTIVDDKKAQPDQERKMVQVTGKKPRLHPKHNMVEDTHKPTPEAPTIGAGRNAYGYAEDPRRIDPNLFLFFGR